eukprot:7391681-Prymnesium_polylepis.1
MRPDLIASTHSPVSFGSIDGSSRRSSTAHRLRTAGSAPAVEKPVRSSTASIVALDSLRALKASSAALRD